MKELTPDEWQNKRTVITHPNVTSGHSKYFPNQKRIDFDMETGESFDVSINSYGFRGSDLDQDRDVLVSWVHLSPKGNRMVAQAFADKILEHDWEK